MSAHQHNPIEFYSDAEDDPLFVKCADCGEVLDVSRPLLESLYNRPPEVSVELNSCPTHGAVDKDHRCPEFDGVLRDAWTGDTLDDSIYPDRSHRQGGRHDGPSLKHLGMTENGTQYRP